MKTRRPDPVNAVLSLAYTLLLNEVEVAVEAAGLDAAGGFYHVAGDGRPTLLMDLVEPLRPIRFAARLLRSALVPDDFERAGDACHVRDGRRGLLYKAWEQLLGDTVRWRGETRPGGGWPTCRRPSSPAGWPAGATRFASGIRAP